MASTSTADPAAKADSDLANVLAALSTKAKEAQDFAVAQFEKGFNGAPGTVGAAAKQ